MIPRLSAPREYACLVLGLGGLALLCLLWLPLAAMLNLLLPEAPARRLGRRAISVGFRAYLGWLSWLGACRFDLAGLDGLRGEGALILAPNHPCLLDAVMVLSRLPDVACILKASLMDNPLFGAAARLARYIRNDAPLAMILSAEEELAGGAKLLLFPEGSRTRRYPVDACKPSLALIAGRAKVPVQVILIETDSAYLAKGWPLFRRPAMPIHYRLRLGRRFDPPADPAGFTAELERHFADELGRAELVPPAVAA